jgi:hypothetical protein
MTNEAREAPFRRKKRKAEDVRPDGENLDEPPGPPERDLFDSPSDSWRDLELREMLDEIGLASHVDGAAVISTR